MEAKFKEIAGAADVILINIEGGTGACGAFNASPPSLCRTTV